MNSFLSVAETVSLVASGKAVPEELARQAQTRVRERPLPTNAFRSLCEIQVQESARIRELEGVTFAVKDNIHLAGQVTTCGSIIPTRIDEQDAVVVQHLKAAGAICIGKTNLHEFALGATNVNPHFGNVGNPWNLAHIPGGSSGGSAAAVATGEVQFALGTDSGGSVRIPASMCGIVGFKPTGGSVNLRGIEGSCWTLDNYGIFARSVPDAKAIWGVMSHRQGHPAAAPANPRAAYLDDDSMGMVAPEIWEMYQGGIAKLKNAGWQLHGISLRGFERAPFIGLAIAYPEISSQHARWIRERPQDYGEDIRTLIQLGEILGARHYVTAQRARVVMRASYLKQTAGFDAVFMPTLPLTTPKIGDPAQVPGEVSKSTLFSLVRFTILFNAIGFPAVSVPIGLDSQRLPVGMQVVGLPKQDDALLDLANEIEACLGFLGAPPLRVEA